MKTNGMPTEGATLLGGFLLDRQVSQAKAAKALGVSGPTVHDWVHSRKRPRAEHRRAIARWTRGVVPVRAWLTDEERALVSAVRKEAA